MVNGLGEQVTHMNSTDGHHQNPTRGAGLDYGDALILQKDKHICTDKIHTLSKAIDIFYIFYF